MMNPEALGPFIPLILLIGVFLPIMMLGYALACMFLADKKGLSPVLWFVLGLFFSVIALFIVALIPKNKSEPELIELYIELEQQKKRLAELEREQRKKKRDDFDRDFDLFN